MSNTLRLDGVAELMADLRKLPVKLRDEASTIVFANADAAAMEIRAEYPVRSGKLAGGVSVQHRTGPFWTRAIVRNLAKLAFIFENGTQARHTELGANRGAMPPGHVFVPTIIRRRRAMYEDLSDLVESNGLKVTGQP